MKSISGKLWKKALDSGVNAILNESERINAMNVFPVPDGDTGTNMGSTMRSARKEADTLKDEDAIGAIAKKFSRGALLGARGNSGVILSQIFKGISVAFDQKTEASVTDVVNSFEVATEYAYKSVMTPVEGTILTVVRLISEDLVKAKLSTIEEMFELILASGRVACDKTPDLLPVLKEVGVNDSGGEGLLLILDGIAKSLKGKPITEKTQSEQEALSFFDTPEVYDGEFGYCTEFVVELKSPKSFKKDKFQKAITKFGDSIVVVHDEDILKTHLHTLKPGEVFTFAQKYGEFISLKSDNMTLQANSSSGAKLAKGQDEVQKKKDINIGVISANVGQGIIDDMKELGADFIIEGGQSMNPSAQDFIKAIDSINSKRIIILPNNPNIILVAQQVAQINKKKEIIIVPSKTQMQGLSAMMTFLKDSTLTENQELMNDAIQEVKTGQVTIATRSTKIGGVSVKKDEFLAIADRKIIKSTTSKVKAAIITAKKLIDKDSEIITIYYGQDATKVDASEIGTFIEAKYNIEVEIKKGDQPVYHFLMAVE